MLYSSIVVQHFASRHDLRLGSQGLFQKWSTGAGLPYQDTASLENLPFLPIGQNVWEYLIPGHLATFPRHITASAFLPDSFLRLFPL
jgi:hypothetical protein